MRATNPTHKTTHFSIDQWAENQMIVVGHQLVTVKLNFESLESFAEDFLKRREVTFFFEDVSPEIAPIESMIQTASDIGAWWTRHGLRVLQKVSE